VDKESYIIGPVAPVAKKKDRKRAADVLARQLMKLLAEDYDVIEITGYRYGDSDHADLRISVYGVRQNP
jgi:hypothetical protein